MSEITRVGADLAKRVIQIHAVDSAGHRVCARALPRNKFLLWCAQLPPGCMVAMEASSSAHHWALEVQARSNPARVKVVVASFMQPTAVYQCSPNAL